MSYGSFGQVAAHELTVRPVCAIHSYADVLLTVN